MSLLLLLRPKGGGEGPPPWAYGDTVLLVDATLTAAQIQNATLTASPLTATLTDAELENPET